ncbi:hypothetical protein DV736_g3446, partial [Chaetothyriales sp. CBS 134916]
MAAVANATAVVLPAANAYTVGTVPSSGLLSTLFGQLNGWTVSLTVVLLAITYDQASYNYHKYGIVGPAWKTPFMGPFLESMFPDFNKYKAKWASGELSCVSVFHKFVVIASTRDMARKVFNSPAFVKPCVVDSAYKLLRPNNWVFLDGKAHVDYRKGLNGLFTRQALEIYLSGQEEVYDKYFNAFVQISKDNGGQPEPWMPIFRELMCAVACRTFVGHYMSEKVVKKIAHDYYLITAALELVNFPIILPFTKSWYGKKAADMVLAEFEKCAAKSEVRMAAGGQPNCIMDAWISQMQASAHYRQKIAHGEKVDDSEKPPQVLRDFSHHEIAMTVFTFLFASQDATSSATTWLFQLMANRPDWLDKVREENLRLRDGDRNKPFTMDMLESMVYTRAVVKETLRYRPPVIMVPYVVKKDFPVTPTYTAKKGSMLIPSVWPATHDPEAYPDPDTYDPERWISGDADKQTKNWLVFGTGPHYCLGQTYAQHNLMAMIGKASLLLDWVHHPTEKSEEIEVFATIFPQICRRSFSASIRPQADFTHTIIGGGVIGLAVASRLSSRPNTTTLLLERHPSAGQETSSRNSEVIHAGLYYGPNSLKTRLCIRGKQLLYDLCEAKAIPYRRTRKWILAQDDAQLAECQKVHSFARAVNVPTRFLARSEISKREPDVRADAGVLESETTGIVDSHGLMTYLEGETQERGGEVVYNTEVRRVEAVDGGKAGFRIYVRPYLHSLSSPSSPSSPSSYLGVEDKDEEEDETVITSETIINSAGLHAIALSNSLLPSPAHHITPYYAKGTYFGYSSGHPKPSTLLYPAPQPGLGGLGTHLTLDLTGRIRFGPDVEWIDDPTDLRPSSARLADAIAAIQRYLPSIDPDAISLDYCGIRPKLGPSASGTSDGSAATFKDFYVREESDRGCMGLVNLLGMESPGLTSSLAVAEEVEQLLYR